jgi:hypothetical protein
MWPGGGMMPPGGMPPGAGGMMPPPGAGGMMPPAMKSAEQREPYTVFVSKIGDINDGVMARLLSLCGVVLSWKRPQDTAGKVKGFGVCEYEGPEATMRAMRLLAGLQVDKYTIMLKLSADMEKKVQEYRMRADAMQAQPGFETPPERQMRDQAMRQQILRAAAEYTSAQSAARAAAAPPAAAAPAPAGADAAAPAPAAPAALAAAAGPPGIDAASAAAPQHAVAPTNAAAPAPELSEADKFLGGLIGTGCANACLRAHLCLRHATAQPDDEHPRKVKEIACDLMNPPTTQF